MIRTVYDLEQRLNARFKDRPFSVTVSEVPQHRVIITKNNADFITIGIKYAYRLIPFTISMHYLLTRNNVLILQLDKNTTVSRGVKVSLLSSPWHADVFSDGICLGPAADLLRKRVPLDSEAPAIITSNFEIVEAVLSNTERPDSMIAKVGTRLGKITKPRLKAAKAIPTGLNVQVRH